MTRGKTETEHREQKNVVTELHEFHPDGSGAIVHAALYGLVNARVPYGTRHSTNTPIKPYEYLQATAGSTDHKPPTEPFRPGCDFHQVGVVGVRVRRGESRRDRERHVGDEEEGESVQDWMTPSKGLEAVA